MSENITRVIENDEDIWGPADAAERGAMLSVDDQKGDVQMDLTAPLELSDGQSIESLIVHAPSTPMVRKFQSVPDDAAPRIRCASS